VRITKSRVEHFRFYLVYFDRDGMINNGIETIRMAEDVGLAYNPSVFSAIPLPFYWRDALGKKFDLNGSICSIIKKATTDQLFQMEREIRKAIKDCEKKKTEKLYVPVISKLKKYHELTIELLPPVTRSNWGRR
jgi:hypothetical protein